MIMMQMSSAFSPTYHPLDRLKALQFPVTQIHGILKRSQGNKCAIKCSENSFYSTNKITKEENISNKKYELFSNNRVPATLQDGYGSSFNDDNNLMSFQDSFLKNINTIYRFARPYALIGSGFEMTTICVLPLQQLADLTPTYFTGVFLATVAGLLMTIYEDGINQLYDVEIDKINKPDLPLASGDLSIGAGIALTSTSLLMSLAIGIMLRSPPLIGSLIIWFLLGSAYSVDLPFLRWKRNSFLTALYLIIVTGFAVPFGYFMHIQKYVLGRPIAITRTLMFAAAIKCCFVVAISILKDIPDEDGDREFGIQTLCVTIGKKRVLWLGVYTLLMAYGVAILIGIFSPFLLNKLVTIIGHSIFAYILNHRARNIDLSNNASTYSFYMLIWKLLSAEALLIPFVRF